jgi:hypothetical protein
MRAPTSKHRPSARATTAGAAPLMAVLLCASPYASAADPAGPRLLPEPAAPPGVPAVVQPANATTTTVQPIEGLGPALDADGLATLRGGDGVEFDIIENTASANGVVSGNHAENIISGTNTLAGEAFSGAAGINTAIQNSGSNVLIQNATVVNVRFADPGL